MERIMLALFFFLICWTSVSSLLSAPLRGAARYNYKRTLSTMHSDANDIKFGGLHHCGIIVSNIEESKLFYKEAFGFSDDSHLRPSVLPFPGAIFGVGSGQIHLMVLPNPDPTEGRPDHGGRDRHVAVNVKNIDGIRLRLEKRNVQYTMSMTGRRAVFCRDLDGNAFEFTEDTTL